MTSDSTRSRPHSSLRLSIGLLLYVSIASPALALTDQFDPGKNAFECMGNCLKANPIARQLGEAAQYCSQKCEEHLKQLAAKGELEPMPTPKPQTPSSSPK